MKMTEQTTLAQLAAYLEAMGNPFLTMMRGLEGGRHAIVYAPGIGTFHGDGETVAQALEAAFTQFRRETLPSGLKTLLERWAQEKPSAEPVAKIGVSLREQTERVMATLTPHEREVLKTRFGVTSRVGQEAVRDPALCFGCSHTVADHPNETGCEVWHDSSERDREVRAIEQRALDKLRGTKP